MDGNTLAHQLFERVQIKRKDESKPPRVFSDYTVVVPPKAALPPGVELMVMM